MTIPIVTIVGPTASGKSELAIEVAQKYNGEIICADSRTVYKGMDIGTAKPSKEEQALAPHHVVDVVEPNVKFTAVDFQTRAKALIGEIGERNRLPIIVGGTGLYIDSILFNYQFGPLAEPIQRERLSTLTTQELQSLCTQRHIPLPVNRQNRRHLVRSIEIGGLLDQTKNLRKHTLVVGITADREVLRQRITRRAKQMFAQGVVEETARLAKRYGWEHESMSGNIYRVCKEVIEGGKSRDDALVEFIQRDMNLAKRQVTWFKRNPYIIWSSSADDLMRHIDHFLRSSNI